MKDPVDKVIEYILAIESGYSNHKDDTGGKTMYGITEKVAREHGYKGEMPALPRSLAKEIYLSSYFLSPHFDRVYRISQKIAAEMFEQAVNMGTSFPAKALQRSLNVLNEKQTLYKDLTVDGAIGPASLSALEIVMKKRPLAEEVILKMLNSLQCVKYIELAETNPRYDSFTLGWIVNRVELEKQDVRKA